MCRPCTFTSVFTQTKLDSLWRVDEVFPCNISETEALSFVFLPHNTKFNAFSEAEAENEKQFRKQLTLLSLN